MKTEILKSGTKKYTLDLKQDCGKVVVLHDQKRRKVTVKARDIVSNNTTMSLQMMCVDGQCTSVRESFPKGALGSEASEANKALYMSLCGQLPNRVINGLEPIMFSVGLPKLEARLIYDGHR